MRPIGLALLLVWVIALGAGSPARADRLLLDDGSDLEGRLDLERALARVEPGDEALASLAAGATIDVAGGVFEAPADDGTTLRLRWAVPALSVVGDEGEAIVPSDRVVGFELAGEGDGPRVVAVPTLAGAPADLDPPARDGEPYRIGRGDLVGIRSVRHAELTTSFQVRPDGRGTVLLLGSIPVEGLTARELDELLTERYRDHFESPELTVTLRQMRAVDESRVYVGGEVGRPREIPLHVPGTVLQMIISAGDFLDSAAPSSVLLLRATGEAGAREVRRLDLRGPEDGELAAGDIPVQPYDVIYVPPTFIAEVGTFVDQHIDQILPGAVDVDVRVTTVDNIP